MSHSRMPARLVPTAVDLAMLEDIYQLGAVTTPVALTLRRSHQLCGMGGTSACRSMANHRRRMATLSAHGLLSRFPDRFGMVVGSRASVYVVESGIAAAAAATRRHYADLPSEQWTALRSSAAARREWLVDLLVDRGHAAASVRARLDLMSTVALRFYAGESSLRHRTLASIAASILWLGARASGRLVHGVLPDGAAELIAHASSRAVVKPDLVFGIDDTAIVLEAETGTASKSKVASKLAQYETLLAAGDLGEQLARLTGHAFTRLRILVHCASDAHARLVATAASARSAQLRAVLRITGPADLSLATAEDTDLAAEDVVRNRSLPSGQDLFGFLASRLDAPIYAAVQGGATSVRLTCTPLLGETTT